MKANALLKNKVFLTRVGLAIVVVIVLIVVFAGNKSQNSDSLAPRPQKIKEDVKLLTTADTGKALEIQALLAREGITVRQGGKGNKIDLILAKDDDITNLQRDTAIITIVKSGIMDKNIGLEIFDKGDFTSSREDKKIRLARAINGELARLIKKIPGIEDASVFVSIPKDTIFTSLKQPTTATVQIVLAPGADKLDTDIIRAVKNLLLGSVEGLEAENISISDTNGNVYSSIMSASDDMMKLLEDKDNYMKKKIIAQLDKLVGKGNYVVTVSTYLREAPAETAKLVYNPNDSTIGNKQKFSENLGDSSQDKNKVSGAVSSHLPNDLFGGDSQSNRNYNREAEEYSYKVGQTQVSEYLKPGMLEEISIAVTLSKGSVPSGTDIDGLKQLIATSASPKAKADNVEIAFSDKISPYLNQERPIQLPEPESSGNPWWTVAAVLGAMLFIGLAFISGRAKDSERKHQKEIDSLLQLAEKQEKAIEEANKKALSLQETQQQMYKQLTANQQRINTQQQVPVAVAQPAQEINVAIEEDVDEQEFATTLKSWIESSE
ncbi:MAG: hypothetical protein A2Y25_01850 [Candidatus Melainabacteria bacterium GWF2_37_15]|nr:MAG: hypothetical protein A2Y25_01850 [Candidatus Melainabacteria bacterium GWF2_37_15]